MAYATPAEIRLVSGIKKTDVTDTQLEDLRDKFVISKLNQDLNYSVEDEKITQINSEKENDVNGTNKTFYLRKCHNTINQIGDSNDDGVVDTTDLYFYTLDNSGNRTEYAVDSISDADVGKFQLSNAPSGNETPYVSYEVAPLDERTPHNLVSLACSQLTAAYAFTNIEAAKLQSYKIGKVNIKKQSQGFSVMNDRYQETLDKINSRMAQSGESNVSKSEG